MSQTCACTDCLKSAQQLIQKPPKCHHQTLLGRGPAAEFAAEEGHLAEVDSTSAGREDALSL